MNDVVKMMKANKYPGAVWEYKDGSFSILNHLNGQSGPLQFDKDFLKVLDL